MSRQLYRIKMLAIPTVALLWTVAGCGLQDAILDGAFLGVSQTVAALLGGLLLGTS